VDGLVAALAAAAAAGVGDDNAVARATEQLARLKGEAAAAALAAVVATSHAPEDLPALAAAMDDAIRGGAAADGAPLAEARARYDAIDRGARARRDVDASLIPVLAAPDLPSLAALVRSADVAGVTSPAIEEARGLVAEMRAAVDRGRLAALLRGATRLRSVAALQCAVRGAEAAGGGGGQLRVLGRAKRYLRRLQQAVPASASVAADIDDEDDEDEHDDGDADDEDGDDDGGEDDDDVVEEEEAEEGREGWPAQAPPVAARRVAFDVSDALHLERVLTALFDRQCHAAEAAGVPPPLCRLLHVTQLGAVCRALRGDTHAGNLHRDVQLFQRFDAAGRGALTLSEYLDGWAARTGDEDGPEEIGERVRNMVFS
jgi:hypothetical protein